MSRRRHEGIQCNACGAMNFSGMYLGQNTKVTVKFPVMSYFSICPCLVSSNFFRHAAQMLGVYWLRSVPSMQAWRFGNGRASLCSSDTADHMPRRLCAILWRCVFHLSRRYQPRVNAQLVVVVFTVSDMSMLRIGQCLYSGGSDETFQTYTCPYCGRMGFSVSDLVTHSEACTGDAEPVCSVSCRAQRWH